jgi:SAM-dependent methyltransferase
MYALPFPDGAFDWLWSADCAGYAPGDPLPLVRELARVVRPGGKVALLAWSSQQLLPGYPPLESRLNATPAGIAPFARGTPPAQHFLRAIGWFGEAGLEHARVRTFVRDVQAPLSPTIRQALLSLFDMRWGTGEHDLSAEDRDLYRRLCAPESPELILDRPDYVAFFTYTMFTGVVP